MAEKPQAPQGPSEAEMREVLVRGDAVRQQLSSLEAQREYVLEILTESRRALQTLEHLATAQDGEEVLLPIGAGAFVQGRLAHGGKAIAALGSGVHAEMAASEARDRLRARVESLEAAASAVGRDVARLTDELARLNALAEQFYGA